MTLKSIAQRVSMLAAVVLSPQAFAETVSLQHLQMEREAIEIIGQLEDVGRDVRYNSDRLGSIAKNTQISKWTHIHHLDAIKALVNDGLRPALVRLNEIQPHLPEWKQQSIDKMLDAAQALAADTNSAILAKKDAGGLPPVMNPEYQELIKKVNLHAESLVKTADAAGAYATARLKAAEAGLKVPHK